MKFSPDYSRQLNLPTMSQASQQALSEAHILIFGAGGLGVTATTYLAAAGVGKITIVDFDSIAASNLHRQIIYQISDIDSFKANVTKEFLSKRNPFCEVEAVIDPLPYAKLFEMCRLHTIILDCADDRELSYQLNEIGLKTGTPVVFANASAMSGQLFVLQPALTPRVCFECIWPRGQIIEPPTCAELGVLGPVPGAMGCMQAVETIKLITKCAPVLSNKLLNMDFANHNYMPIALDAEPCTHEDNESDNYMEYRLDETLHRLSVGSLQDIADTPEITIIDIRTPAEVAERPCPVPHQHIQVAELLGNIHDHLSDDGVYMILCTSGKRSGFCSKQIREYGYRALGYKGKW